MKKEQCCSHKTKERSQEEYKNLLNRLNRIEGQIRGIKNMMEKDAYCTDIFVHPETDALIWESGRPASSGQRGRRRDVWNNIQ